MLLCAPLLAVLAAVGVSAEAQWTRRQREHRVSQLSAASQLKLCSMGDTNALFTDLNNIAVERVVGSPAHKRVGSYLNNKLKDSFFTTEWDRFTGNTPYGQKTFRNLVATFDVQAPRRLVLACHYDSKFQPDFVGATDSAAPCALLLDVARSLNAYLHTSPHKDVTLQLVFFDGEEAFRHWTDTDSLYGARHLAAKWNNASYISVDPSSSFSVHKELDRIDVLALLDLLGYRNPNIYNYNGLRAEHFFSDLAQTEAELSRLGCQPAGVRTVFHDRRSYSTVQDDHVPFMQRGVPVLHLIPVPFPPVWHQSSDNLDAIDHDTMLYLSNVIRTFVARYLALNL